MAKASNKKMKVLIIVLICMLSVSLCTLGGLKLYSLLVKPEDYVTITNNQIGDSSSNTGSNGQAGDSSGSQNGLGEGSTGLQTQAAAPVLEFYKGQADCNRKFEVRNMVPGDIEIRYFCVRAHHSQPVTLIFESVVTEQTRSLGDVLDVVVTNSQTGEVICKGTFNEINGKKFAKPLSPTPEGHNTVFYKIQVSMDTSVGNEYQVARLLADFHWYIEEGDDGLDDLPQTGDSFNMMLWGIVISVSLLLFILLFVTRRKEEDENDQI